MVKPTKLSANCSGFEWDHGNIPKNWERHDVSIVECEQLFFNKPIIVKRDKVHSLSENRYYALGRDDKIRIISARDMTKAEMGRYLK
jgi:uncharacterized DUF497 family protein